MSRYFLLILLCIFSTSQNGFAKFKSGNEIEDCLTDLNFEIQKINYSYANKLHILREELELLNSSLKKDNSDNFNSNLAESNGGGDTDTPITRRSIRERIKLCRFIEKC